MKHLLDGALPLFLVQAVAIIVSSRVLGGGARRIGQPLVIAEIVAGILLGPSFLGWISPGTMAVLFPQTSLPALGLSSQIGVVLFMFLVGLEFDPKILASRVRASVVISHSSIAVPFGLGALLGTYLYARLAPPGVPRSSFVLFMGVAMSITAFPVLARILVERRLLKTRIGSIAIACAAVDDVTAWCILAFVVATVRATGIASALVTLVLTLTVIAVMIFVVRPYLARLANRGRITLNQNVVAVVMTLVFISALVTELIGIHAVFGSFLLGAIMPKEGRLASALAERIEDVVVVVFLPLFFVYSGLRTQVGLLDTADSWLMCLAITVVACIGKFGGSAVAARWTGLSWREASAIGILMNTRGLVELVALNIGLDLGVISPALFTMMVVMAIATTMMTGPLLERIHPTKALATELAEQPDAPISSRAFAEPGDQRRTTTLCVALESASRGLVVVCGAISPKAAHHRNYLLRLATTPQRSSFVIKQQTHDADAEVSNEDPLVAYARAQDVSLRMLSFVSNDSVRDVASIAEAKEVDLVILGGLPRIFGASGLTTAIRQLMAPLAADVAVLVDRGVTRVRRVLVVSDGTSRSLAALRVAARMADVGDTHVVAVALSAPNGEDVRDATQRFEVTAVEDVAAIEALLGAKGAEYDLVVVGVADETFDLALGPDASSGPRLVTSSAASMLLVRNGRSTQGREV